MYRKYTKKTKNVLKICANKCAKYQMDMTIESDTTEGEVLNRRLVIINKSF